jgi:hypothetical protein
MRRDYMGRLVPTLVIIFFCAVAFCVRADPVLAQLDQHVYLPIAAQGADLSGLEPPIPQTATPTPTETVSVPPSQTPLPTETPKPEGGGKVVGRMLLKGEAIPEHTGAEYPGPGIFLRVCRGSEIDCDVVDRVGVDAESRYELTYGQALGPGEFVQVIWWNEFGMFGDHEVSGDSKYLGAWYGPPILSLNPNLAFELEDIELANVPLLSPTKGTGFQGFPIPFKWGRWHLPPKAYRWSICKCCQNLHQRPGAYQRSVGTETEYALDSNPPGTRLDPDEKYCWFIQVDADNKTGYGQSFEARMMWFIPQVLDPLAVVRGFDWVTLE